MLIFTQIADIRRFIAQQKDQNKSIGFVPTMGALHKGHISLTETSKKNCNITVCSIFVNPTQFNDKKDLERYPRTPEKDTELLEKNGCDVLFLPSVHEMYPNGTEKELFDFGNLDKILEGHFRAGHFSGVAQVVKRLFEIVTPDKAFFGSKDYQQVMIVKALVKQMHAPIEIVACPILRETDGLAMSSRNVLLSEEERKISSVIPKLMQEAKTIILQKGIEAGKTFIENETSKQPLMKLDYFEVCHADTLQIISNLNESKNRIALIACFVGRIRLIDNLSL
ncbi:MAG: pantoate--beta-alanine ligase [Bacteroidetes bacterium]|nr:pantoate--beta-alanine ligase [Bacteroidota bacterium]